MSKEKSNLRSELAALSYIELLKRARKEGVSFLNKTPQEIINEMVKKDSPKGTTKDSENEPLEVPAKPKEEVSPKPKKEESKVESKKEDKPKKEDEPKKSPPKSKKSTKSKAPDFETTEEVLEHYAGNEKLLQLMESSIEDGMKSGGKVYLEFFKAGMQKKHIATFFQKSYPAVHIGIKNASKKK